MIAHLAYVSERADIDGEIARLRKKQRFSIILSSFVYSLQKQVQLIH
jgi:hypothetical protein